MTTNHARRERTALCDLALELGPRVPTLCEGWDAADLLAHLAVRERRPDAAMGILAAPFERHGDSVRRRYAQRPFPELVELVRSGPPTLSPMALGPVDRLVNTMEYYVHHEDLRRPNGLGPRDLPADQEDQLWDVLRRMSKLLLRSSPCGVLLDAGDARTMTARAGTPVVTVRGPVGELALFVYGRQGAAEVELDGPADAAEALRSASFGI